MSRLPLRSLPVFLALFAGCTGTEEPNFGWGSGGDDGEESDTDTDTDTDSDTDADTDTDTDADSDSSFDDPGDVVTYEDDDAQSEVVLTDDSGESNTGQEYFLIVLNNAETALTYDLRYSVPTDDGSGDGGDGGDDGDDGDDTGGDDGDDTGGSDTGSAMVAGPSGKGSPFRQHLRELRRTGELNHVGAKGPAPAPLAVGESRQEFRVRDSLVDDTTYEVRDAVLWAVGDSVAIWVDEDVPIDWDYDCDGEIDEEHRYEAYGFDNCDLQTIAEIVDTNIIPNLESAFGSISDLNEDGVTSVVITPTLNAMSVTSEDDENWGNLVGSYADPEVDLIDWDAQDNPASDEQEVVFVFAPDPYGFYNPFQATTVDKYTSVALAAEIARAFMFLIDYNQKVIEKSGTEVEETWLLEGLGALAADLTGFGAHYHDAAWNYLDAPHLYSLVDSDDADVINARSWGAQYLFLRYLYDSSDDPASLLTSLVQTDAVGTSNVVTATGAADFSTLALEWQVALLTTGVTNTDGDPLVSVDEYTPYADASTINSPPDGSGDDDRYGANGYQEGVNVRGLNRTYEGGTTTTPSENEGFRVKMENSDHYTMVTGFDFEGYVAGNYAAQIVRLTDIPFDSASIRLQGSSSDFTGVVVRWNDPTFTDVAIEDIFSPTDAQSIALPELPSGDDPAVIYGVGEITKAAYVNVINEDGETEATELTDTDRWLLDLSDRTTGEAVNVALWLDRRFAGDSGDPALYDPWIAVVPVDAVPTPTVSTLNSDSCADGTEFTYPTSLLSYLFYQKLLSGNAVSDTESFDPCGEASEEEISCDEDWDLDEVADTDEPLPSTFLEQLLVQQCEDADGDMSSVEPYDTAVFDVDEVDEDDTPTVNRKSNTGSVSAGDGEEAYIEIELTGGEQYLVIVGGGSDTGIYELSLRQLD